MSFELQQDMMWNDFVNEAVSLCKGKTKKIVYFFCDHFGDRTSLNEIHNFTCEALKRYAKKHKLQYHQFHKQLMCIYRCQWRVEHNSTVDARTHKDIPRRNMIQDDMVNVHVWNKLQASDKKQLEWMLSIAKQVHSIDALVQVTGLAMDVRRRVRFAA